MINPQLRALRRLLFVAAAMLLSATGAHALVTDCDPEAPTRGCPGYTQPTPPPAVTPVGPLYIFGTHNTLATVLVYDVVSAQLCSPNLANCRPASGLDALRRGTQFAVSQLLQWDRSGIFAINASEIIACFSYFDGPGGAAFNCATAPRNGLNGYDLQVAATNLGKQTYTGSGLVQLANAKVNAKSANRKHVTAYLLANGQLPENRMRALYYEAGEDGFGDGGGGGGGYEPLDPGTAADIELERVEIVGQRIVDGGGVSPPPPSIVLDLVTITGNREQPPEIVLNPCVSFAACTAPPPPPPPPAPQPRICSSQCTAQQQAVQATCSVTTGQIGATFGVVAPVTGIIVGLIQPELGYPVFKAVGGIGTGATAAYFAACSLLNSYSTQQCMAKASSNGC